MNNRWISKFIITFTLLAALLLSGCQTIATSAVEEEIIAPPPEEPAPEETEEPAPLPEPLTEEETMAIFEEVEPMWDLVEYDPEEYTDWVEIDCDTTTGEGCLLPNGCDLSTGEGCTLDDGCNYVTGEGCILPDGCNLETGEGCEILDGCNPITFEGCPVLEGCDLETGENCEILGCNIITGEGCELDDGCNVITDEGCTIPYGDGTYPEDWDEIDAMWALVEQDWQDAEANGEWQEGFYSGLDLLNGEWEGEFNGHWFSEEDFAGFFD